jgi:hypothetical protein
MQQDAEARRKAARERKRKSRARLMEGAATVALVIDLEQQEELAALGLLPRDRDPGKAEIAAAVATWLRAKLRHA